MLVGLLVHAATLSAPLSGQNAFKGNYYGCQNAASKTRKYCDVSLSDEERVADIVGKLTLAEKIAFGSPTKKPFCACHTAPTAGLPDYKWLTEANSCIDSPCHPGAEGKCATIFVGPNNMAASFNRSSWYAKGDVVSTDIRAFNNIGDAMVGAQKNHDLGARSGERTDEYGLLGLSGYGPNINVVNGDANSRGHVGPLGTFSRTPWDPL
jgi:beta-D-xylosidase 4